MKVLYTVCFPLALWLVMVPLPCTGSPSPEAVSSDEINSVAIDMDSFEPSAGAASTEPFAPLDLVVSANREDEPDQASLTETPPPSSQPE